MGENLTVRNLHVQCLAPGDRLYLEPGVVLELTAVRKPCYLLDQIDPRLKEVAIGRCVYIAKVIATGILRAAQKVTVHPNLSTFSEGIGQGWQGQGEMEQRA